MTSTLSSTPVARPRWRSLLATFALVGALVTTGSAVPATAEDIGTGPGVISGTVTDPDGQPIEGAFVGASISFGEGTAFWAYTESGSAGHYEFTDLALGYTYGMSIQMAGYQNQPWQDAALTDLSPTATVDFVLVPFAVGTGTISGQVTGDGVPLANTYVGLNSDAGQGMDTVTDENGFYQFTGLANGAWNIYAITGGNYQYLNPPIIQLTDSAPHATVDLPFLSWPVGTSSISGVVTDAATGEPIADVPVSAFSDSPYNSATTTDAEGAFTFELLPEGTYSLHFWASGYLLALTSEIQVPADSHVTVNRALLAANATVNGHIKTKDGAPAAGVSVNLYTEDGNWANAVTDENGDYVVNEVGATPYTIWVGGPGTPYEFQERIVTPVANGTVTVDFTLKNRKTGALSGFVAEPGGEWYQEPVCVTLYSSKKKKPIAETVTWGPEFGDGSFYFSDLKPGSYTVEFEDCDDDPFKKFDNVFLGGAKTYKDATFVTIAAGQDSWDNSITLTYRTANSTISGHIAKPNGTPIAGLTVHATDGLVNADAVTDAAGNYTFSGLFSGEYTVTAGGVGTPYVHKHKSVTVDEDGSATANFTLGKR